MKKVTTWLSLHRALLVLAVAAGFIGIGVVRGEHTTVLQKAIMICLECIGLG